ncbi:putative transcription factor C2H2 family [Helianthus annuus]|nr:putative transcription factor C2H2 family [Helianthus annuus]
MRIIKGVYRQHGHTFHNIETIAMDQNMINFIYEIKRVVVVVLVLLTTNCFATNEPPSAVSPPPKKKPKISLQMAILLASLLTAFLLICFLFFYFRRYAERQLALAATSGDQRTAMKLAVVRGLDPAVIAAFTSFTYSTVKDIKIGQQVLECAVCLNEFLDHEALRLLPECSHVFHRDCIDEWLASHITCPVCRASLVPKPSQPRRETELPCGSNRHTKDHVSVEFFNLEHDLAPPRKLSRSFSMGHMMVQKTIENDDRYTLRLPDKVQSVLKTKFIGTGTATETGIDVSLSVESSLKTSLKSASANFVRGSNYFDYQRFGHERQSGGHTFGITGSFISRSGSGNGFARDVEDSTTGSERFLTSMRSPLNRLLQLSNKDTNIMIRLNDC